MYPLIFVAFLASVNGQLVLEGACNFTSLEAVRNLNVSQFFGEWHQISRIDNAYEVGDCSSSHYHGVVESGTFMNGTVENKQVVNRTIHWTNGTFTASGNGVYLFRYPDMTLDTVVLATDYTGYGLLYSCAQNATHRSVWSWQISRSKQLTAEQSNLINAAISLNSDIRNATWRAVSHTVDHCGTSAALSYIASPVLLAVVLCNILTKFLD